MKNRTVIGIICIAFAFLVFFATIPMISNKTTAGTSCIRAKSKIARGSCITKEDIEVYTSAEKHEGALNQEELIIGKYAVCDIFPGDSFTVEKLTDVSDSAAQSLCRLSDGELAVTVPVVNLSAGFSGQLENGDIVRVFIRKDTGSEVPDELQYVRVITTVTSEGVSRDGAKAGSQQADALPASVMLAVNDEQASILFSHCADSSLYLAFVCHSYDGRAQGYLDTQKAYFSRQADENAAAAAEYPGKES